MRQNVIVRGGTLVDGTGGPSRRADVRVREGKITEIGPDLKPDGETEIDASGATVAPGFIDGHTHFDPSLFWDQACDPMPQHGVTTVLFGNCSLSLAPVRAAHRKQVSDTFGLIEEFPEIAFTDHVPWDWETYPDYIGSMSRRGFGVNVAGLVGLSMLRLYVLGEEAWERPSTAEERRQVVHLLEEALAAGAAGFSTSFFDRGPDGRLVPSAMVDDDELSALIAATGRHRGHFETIPADVNKGRGKAMESLEQQARWCAAAGVTLTWNAFFDLQSDPTFSEDYLAFAQRLQKEGLPALPTVSPRPVDFMMNWDGGLSFLKLAAWNDFLQAPRPAKQKMLSDPAWRARAARDWDSADEGAFPHRRIETVIITQVEHPELARFAGKPLTAWVDEHGGHPSDALADWVAKNDLRPELAFTVGNHDPARLGRLLADPATLVSASDAGAHVQGLCTSGDTTLLLTRYVRELGLFSLERGVAELTSRQADVYGFTDRGRLEVGKAGDLVVFDLDELRWGDQEPVHDFPGGGLRYRRPPGGYRATVANGVVTQIGGKSTGALPGAWLPGKHPGAALA